MSGSLAQRLLMLSEAVPLWLDGPTGTQLEANGFRSQPQLWTALASIDAPELLASVHRRYLQAGADCVTANTFRTTAFAAQLAGVDMARMQACCRQAVRIARQVCREFPSRFVLGSMAPLADCYQPDRVPTDGMLAREHARNVDWLLEAGCDGLLLETQGVTREVLCAVRSARRLWDGPILVSFLPGDRGNTLLGGDDLPQTARACLDLGASAILLNCAHVDVILRALQCLSALSFPTGYGPILLGAYPNAAHRVEQAGQWLWQADPDAARRLPTYARQLVASGARIVGACCGFGPDDLAQMIAAWTSDRVLGPSAT